MRNTALIAIDWGTSSARAYRLGRDGERLGARETPLGIQHVRDGNFAGALSILLGEWSAIDVPRIASGMIGSRQGWVEAPYLRCPARFGELASGLVHTAGNELAIVPGVTTRDTAGIPDVMRGEETQLAGAVPPGPAVLAVLPGTHSKWARVEAESIVDFRTFMTGELYAALLDHTILGRLAERSSVPLDAAAFARGVARGLDDGELSHDLFGARALALMGDLAGREVPDWLSGLLIGREIRAARAWGSELIRDAASVRIIGSDALVERYARAMAQARVAAEPVHDAAVRGLWRIARDAGLLR